MTHGNEAPELGELRAELARRFDQELDERVPRMERSLQRLLASDDPGSTRETLAALALDAHSIKGGAQLTGRPDVGRLAEALEGHFDRLAASVPGAAGQGGPRTPQETGLEDAGAALALLRRLAAGETLGAAEIEESIRALEGG